MRLIFGIWSGGCLINSLFRNVPIRFHAARKQKALNLMGSLGRHVLNIKFVQLYYKRQL